MNTNNDWNEDMETILENIRINCIILSKYHKEKYYEYKSQLKYFKLPLIILSSITSVISVGMDNYMEQNTISITTCLLSLFSAIIASIELYLGVQKSMEIELNACRNFQLLSYDIYKTLSLNREYRLENGRTFLDNTYKYYTEQVKLANIIKSKKLTDKLAPINAELTASFTSNSSTGSNENTIIRVNEIDL
jgi:hypothetical protein